ncbi:tRNA uridine-5-carboxymethylaminomethyl(34) synthesis GTPase MnmE [Hoeflea ulvae]|uniref:tRNA modification GTPase MnmE n=1 Tax=Hoeflea ulvae TaxID=2983764 RepID=A0ABT3YAB4_9HYPH|nr:tRNA uridine-5-carboxymethylaminomethyl(34) synthesis GTPase MnmE [Hoeflea ulvae]MCY0092813.1 tRNA uridine-5-carboxymethylaminomethyl(34) synthesis GTPase MnmE [Hoeflea ulvae]
MRETIFALSTGHPPAGVAVIRISGPGVRFGLETLTGSVPPARVARLCALRDSNGLVLDRGLVLYFPGPQSFTGEDVAELQIHGSRASISAVLESLSELEGYRPAEAGEYTRRAFENGCMDLTAVEGLSDLIRAETEAQRRQALGQADGTLQILYDTWAKRLTHARAMIEAELDFSDEDDIPGSVTDRIWPEMKLLAEEISDHLNKARYGEIVRDGFRVALVGAPNVGKSSLLNSLAGRDIAIVSDIPGTTRDVIETRLDLGGHLVVLQDTAGLRDTESPVELEGIRRSRLTADTADLVLELRELGTGVALTHPPLPDDKVLMLWTKSDLMEGQELRAKSDGLAISSKTGHGLDALVALISERLDKLGRGTTEGLPTRERHVLLLQTCLKEVGAALDAISAPIEIRSEHLRFAAVALGRITGTVDVEDLLGVIFSEFCVGK